MTDPLQIERVTVAEIEEFGEASVRANTSVNSDGGGATHDDVDWALARSPAQSRRCPLPRLSHENSSSGETKSKGTTSSRDILRSQRNERPRD